MVLVVIPSLAIPSLALLSLALLSLVIPSLVIISLVMLELSYELFLFQKMLDLSLSLFGILKYQHLLGH
jgi:hypothetical protein